MLVKSLGNVGSNPASPAKCSPEAFGGLSSSGLGHRVYRVSVNAELRGETVGGRHGSYARLTPYLPRIFHS